MQPRQKPLSYEGGIWGLNMYAAIKRAKFSPILMYQPAILSA
jgi:hypothetical protein